MEVYVVCLFCFFVFGVKSHPGVWSECLFCFCVFGVKSQWSG